MVKYIALAMPVELHTAIKIKAAQEQLSLKELVIKTLQASLQKGGTKAG